MATWRQASSIREPLEMHKIFWLEKHKEKDNLENLGFDTQVRGVAQHKDQWRVFVSTAMNILVSQNVGNIFNC